MLTEKGQSIEDASMQVIENEIGAHNYNEKEWPIVRRVIHSTADFDFARNNSIIFHNDAIENGLNALKTGRSIIVDVNGVVGLINKQRVKEFGNNIICKISDSEIVLQAQKENKTKSQMSMRMASSDIDGGIVVVGNAPTALLEVIQMIKEKAVKPALVIGMPVGFISAAESKEELAKMDVPFITNKGRKGGSPSAAAIVNALYKLI
ncbi:MAG: precorrin-8X methylmutase [Thaumarchaeota archaeon]|nr:precorrin-8X methylmutase [Nitrososphaerota archaeon]